MAITFLFYKGKTTFADRFIACWTRGPYSHCEVVLETYPDGSVLCASASLRDDGVRCKRMVLKPHHWDALVVPEHRGFSLDAIQDWFRRHEGRKYDVLGVFFFIGVMPHAEDRWFCSEAVGEACGIPDAWRFDPNRLHALLRLVGQTCALPSHKASSETGAG